MTLPKLNGDSKFWQFNLGHLLTIIGLVVAGLAAVISNDRRMSHLEINAEYGEKRLVVVETVLEKQGPVLQSTATNLDFLTKYIREEAGKKK